MLRTWTSSCLDNVNLCGRWLRRTKILWNWWFCEATIKLFKFHILHEMIHNLTHFQGTDNEPQCQKFMHIWIHEWKSSFVLFRYFHAWIEHKPQNSIFGFEMLREEIFKYMYSHKDHYWVLTSLPLLNL
jgi:hypothetical protein